MRRDHLTNRVKNRLKCGLHSSSFHTQELCSNDIYLCSGLLDDAGNSSKHSAEAENIKEPHPLLFQALEFDQGEAIFKQPTFSHSFFFFLKPFYQIRLQMQKQNLGLGLPPVLCPEQH